MSLSKSGYCSRAFLIFFRLNEFVVIAPPLALHLVVFHHEFEHLDLVLRLAALDAQLLGDRGDVRLVVPETPVRNRPARTASSLLFGVQF